MSRRAIGEEPEVVVKPKPALVEELVKKPPEEPVKKTSENTPVPVKETPPALKGASSPGINNLLALITAQAQSAGLTDEPALGNFCDFMQGQAARYIRGFDAARRFHG